MVLADAFILSQLPAFLLVWFPHQYHSKITTVHHEVMKAALGLRKFTTIPTRYSLLGWLTIKDQIFIQYFKILTKIKALRDDHSLKKKDFPTLYHKQLVQKYDKYRINDDYLEYSAKQTKNYLTSLIINTHIMEKIPAQLQLKSTS